MRPPPLPAPIPKPLPCFSVSYKPLDNTESYYWFYKPYKLAKSCKLSLTPCMSFQLQILFFVTIDDYNWNNKLSFKPIWLRIILIIYNLVDEHRKYIKKQLHLKCIAEAEICYPYQVIYFSTSIWLKLKSNFYQISYIS